jgi:LPS export ABC transporter protein LptC
MAIWQKRARLVVAVFGIAAAVIVYFAVGRRPPPAALDEVKRIDPTATAESPGGCTAKRFRGDKADFELTCETQLVYADGRVQMKKVTIRVRKPDGRSYVVTAGEAYSSQDQKQLQLSSGVKLVVSDGFQLTTDRASYNGDLGSFHSDVPISFSKGRMSGSGTNVEYNETNDVLTIHEAAKVVTVNERGMTTLDFSAGSATLDRLSDVLTMDGSVHVLRDTQIMDADRAVARLAPNEEFVTYMELRGNARVQGGGGTLDAMSARDIDLDYTDDGAVLERVALNGDSGITLTGTAGASGRQLMGESLEIRLATDGMVTSATGRQNVQMAMPAAENAPARVIRGRTLDATGAPGQGLTAAHFADAVEYREEAARSNSARIARSRRLDLALNGDAVTDATFAGDFVFEEASFRAQAADARYDPKVGSLHLSGADTRGLPCIADDQIAVDAQTIDVTVETRRLSAEGRVKNAIRPAGASGSISSSSCAVARQRGGASAAKPASDGDGQTRLPGLLKQDQLANASSDRLEYGGTGQSLVYTGNAFLGQGDTSLRGNVIRIDQEHGDLIVTGNATSRIVQGAGEDREMVRGNAQEIQYVESRRMISYRNAVGSAAKTADGKLVQVNGPQGNLAANSVDIVLNKDTGKADRLEAYQNVTAKIDTKTATADRLTYLAETDQYDMRGAGPVPARIVDACGATSGKALTYSKRDKTIDVRGNGEQRTQTKSAACPQPAPSTR